MRMPSCWLFWDRCVLLLLNLVSGHPPLLDHLLAKEYQNIESRLNENFVHFNVEPSKLTALYHWHCLCSSCLVFDLIVLNVQPIDVPDDPHLLDTFEDFVFDVGGSSVNVDPTTQPFPTAATSTLAVQSETQSPSSAVYNSTPASTSDSQTSSPATQSSHRSSSNAQQRPSGFSGHGLRIPARLIKNLVQDFQTQGKASRRVYDLSEQGLL